MTDWEMPSEQVQAVINGLTARYEKAHGKRNGISFSWEHVVEEAVRLGIVVPATQGPLAEEVLRSGHGSEADTGGSPYVVVPSAPAGELREKIEALKRDPAYGITDPAWNAALDAVLALTPESPK